MKMLPEAISFYGAAAVGAYPLDMSQYKNLFQSTRVPGIGEDSLQVFPDSKHIIVQRGSDFFKFDVLKADGTAVADAEILAQIDAILATPANVTSNGLGLMTTLGRDEWASARAHLIASGSNNAASLRDIDSALFMVHCHSLGCLLSDATW